MASVTFTAAAGVTAGSPVTYANLSIGTGGGERRIKAGVMVRRIGGPISITSVTCADVAMTPVANGVEGSSPTNGNARVQWFEIAASALGDPSAATASFVIITDNTLTRSSIDVAVTSDDVTLLDTAIATISNAPASPQNMSLDIDAAEGGFILALATATDQGATSASFAWTGLTENNDRLVASTGISTASANAVSAATPRTVSAAVTVSTNIIAGAASVISFAPVEVPPVVQADRSDEFIGIGLSV